MPCDQRDRLRVVSAPRMLGTSRSRVPADHGRDRPGPLQGTGTPKALRAGADPLKREMKRETHRISGRFPGHGPSRGSGHPYRWVHGCPDSASMGVPEAVLGGCPGMAPDVQKFDGCPGSPAGVMGVPRQLPAGGCPVHMGVPGRVRRHGCPESAVGVPVGSARGVRSRAARAVAGGRGGRTRRSGPGRRGRCVPAPASRCG